MIKLKKIEILVIILIIIYFAFAAIIYHQLPGTIATHWNAQGVADGFSTKSFGVFIMPIFFILVLVIYSLFSRSEYFKNPDIQRQLNTTILMSVLFLFYVSILSLIYNLGFKFNMSYFIIPATSILFISLGIVLKKIKQRNPFFGIRTPWTLLDQEVWEKTHKFGGNLFIALGIITLFAVFYLKYFATIFLVAILGLLISCFLYSYIIYKKKKK